MIQHFVSVGAAIFFGVWATVLQQYHEIRGDVPAPIDLVEISVERPALDPSTPSPFEVILDEIEKTATTSPVTPKPSVPQQLPPVTPSIPFTPLPVPVTPVIPTPTPVTPVPTTPTPAVPDFEERVGDETFLKGVVVNVICLPGGELRGSSGSGIIIDPRGIIATVAHVGQGFLLKDYPEDGAGTCYIRTGSPAKNAYAAELIYLSPSWIEDNDTVFLESRPKGTGENDFAFLAITRSLTSAPLPGRFTYAPLAPSGTDIAEGDEVGTASYAAEFLTSSQVRSSLYPTIKFAEVSDVYTFSRSAIDIFSVAAGSAAQEGSSGGGVINDDRQLIGVITTRTVKPDLSMRSLQALTPDHLRRSFRADMGESLDTYLSSNSLSSLISKFSSKADELRAVLTSSLN